MTDIDIGPVECQSAELWDNPPEIDIEWWYRPDDGSQTAAMTRYARSLPPVACGHCGEAFQRRSGSQRYCSDACWIAKEAARPRVRGRSPAGPGDSTAQEAETE